MAAEEHRFPCDNCGADMRFAPGEGQLVCDHCGNTREINAPAAAGPALDELGFQSAVAAKLPAQEIEAKRVSSCPNCGAEIEFDPEIHAIECPFCATPVVVGTGTHRYIKPRGLLPFGLSETEARAAMTDWLGSLWFAPNGLRDYARKGRRLDGIYVPYWTYDADTQSSYRGERGTVHHETRRVRRGGETKTVRVRKIRWSPASGRVARWFDDVLVLASRSLPKRFADGLPPWDLDALEPYQPEYLAGFRAEAYTVSLEDGWTEARAQIDRTIERDVKFDIGGDRQRIHEIRTAVSDITFKHLLLPVWMAAYKYRGQSYRFVVNARTGRVQGERPWSAWKIAFAVVLGAILAGAAGYLIAISENG